VHKVDALSHICQNKSQRFSNIQNITKCTSEENSTTHCFEKEPKKMKVCSTGLLIFPKHLCNNVLSYNVIINNTQMPVYVLHEHFLSCNDHVFSKFGVEKI